MTIPELNISKTLKLPLGLVTQSQAILARKGAGKSYTASVQAEEMLKAHQQIVVIDLTGAWWGLRAGRDGSATGGYPIHVFGGDHADVALDERAGEMIAGALVKERFSAILDVSLFRKAVTIQFLAEFLETLYRLNREAMHLFCDEADYYAPQKPFGNEARSLGAMNDIVRRGRKKGIGCTLISQRPQVINKDILTMSSILTVMRVSHPKDLAPIRDWVETHDVGDHADEMIESLPSLPTGTAWIWAPGWPKKPGIFERVEIRQRETFDSGATPEPGETLKVPKALARVDLVKLGDAMKASIEEAAANDPKALKAKVAELQRQLAARPTIQEEKIKEIEVPVPVIKDAQLKRVESLVERLEVMSAKAMAEIEEVRKLFPMASGPLAPKVTPIPFVANDVNRAAPVISPPISRSPKPAPFGRPAEGSGQISGPMKRILDAIAWFESIGIDEPAHAAVAFKAGYTYGGGGFNNPRGALKTMDLVQYLSGERIALTPSGRKIATPPAFPATTQELHTQVLGILDGPQRRILEPLLAAYPGSMSKESLAAAAGYAHGSGGFNNPCGRLRTLSLIDYPEPGQVVARSILFPGEWR